MDGCPHGHGRIKWPEGTVYDGNWNHGELHGQGTYIWTSIWKFGWIELVWMVRRTLMVFLKSKIYIWIWNGSCEFFGRNWEALLKKKVDNTGDTLGGRRWIKVGSVSDLSFGFYVGEFTPPQKWTCPLKNDGWKAIFPFEMVSFRRHASFRGWKRVVSSFVSFAFFPVSRKRVGLNPMNFLQGGPLSVINGVTV